MGSTFPSMGLIRSSKLKASMKGAVLILAFGTLSFTNGFKLNALQKEVSEHAHHHHDHEEYHEQVEDNSDSSEEARSSSERAVAFNFEDDIQPIIVDSPPPGVNFTECVVNLQTGHCCIDFVGEIRSAVTNPVLECITRNEKVCHTSYVTQFSSRREQVCEMNYEKKCHIVIAEVFANETVKSCMRPLQRVCDEGAEQVVERIRRDTSSHLKTIADILDETLENPRSMMAGRSIGDIQTINAESECKVYFETICTNPKESETHAAISTNNGCERVPVRLCAEGCRIQEGPMTCKDINLSLLKEVPREECEIVPQKTCKTVTKLFPELIPHENCKTTPKEICQLKFSPNPELPSIQPLIQRYCLRGSIETNLIEEENVNEGKSFPTDIKILAQKTEENERNNMRETSKNKDYASSKGPQARKLEISPSDLNQVPEYYQKELELEQAIKGDNIAEQLSDEITQITTDNPILHFDAEIDQTFHLIEEGSGEENDLDDLEDITETLDAIIEDNEQTTEDQTYEMTTDGTLNTEDYKIDTTISSVADVEQSEAQLILEENKDLTKMIIDAALVDTEVLGYYEVDTNTDFPIILIDEQFEEDVNSNGIVNLDLLEVTDEIPTIDTLADAADDYEVTTLVPAISESTVEITTEDSNAEVNTAPAEETADLNESDALKAIEEEFIELESTISPIDDDFEATTEIKREESFDAEDEFVADGDIIEYIAGSGQEELSGDGGVPEAFFITGGSGNTIADIAQGAIVEDFESSGEEDTHDVAMTKTADKSITTENLAVEIAIDFEASGEEDGQEMSTEQVKEEPESIEEVTELNSYVEEHQTVTTLPSIINEVSDTKAKPALPRKIEDEKFDNQIIFPEQEKIKSSSLIELTEKSITSTTEAISTSDSKVVFPESQNDETTTAAYNEKEITIIIETEPTTTTITTTTATTTTITTTTATTTTTTTTTVE